jgi:hypothetical protein
MAAERRPRLFSYVVARDFGFAPNPFEGVCTLATCKAFIRSAARVGDWVIGTGSKSLGLEGRLVYAMRVTEKLTYDDYWDDERFRAKRPNLRGSLKQAFGDNVYHHDGPGGPWTMVNSHHSLLDGTPNTANITSDTRADGVLISDDFVYWGANGPVVPDTFRNFKGDDIVMHGRGHRSVFEPALVKRTIQWLETFDERGCVGTPEAWASGREYRR